LQVLAFLLIAFWTAFGIDRIPALFGGREMPWTARSVWLILVIAGSLFWIVKALREGTLRRFPDEDLALLLERRFKELDGKLLTTVQLHQRSVVENDFAPELLARVHEQAASTVAKLDPAGALRWRPIMKMVGIAVPLLLVTIGAFGLAPTSLQHALQRLLLLSNDPWPRRAQLEMIGVEIPLTTVDDGGGPRETKLVEFVDRRLVVGRGEPAVIRIRAHAVGHRVPEVCTLHYRTASGLRGQANLRRAGRRTEGWQAFMIDGPPLDSINERISFEIRGLDSRLEDYSIDVVDPPPLQTLELAIDPPPYLTDSGAIATIRPFQPGIRVAEGARVRLQGKCSGKGLKEVLASRVTAGEEPHHLRTIVADKGEFTADLGPVYKPVTCILVTVGDDGVRSLAPYRYLINILPDVPPDVKLRLKGLREAVTPNALLPTRGHARDDYQIVAPKLMLHASSKESDTGQTVERGLQLGRDGEFSDQFDLEQLTRDKVLGPLTPGSTLAISAEAKDAYDLGPAHVSSSDRIPLEIVTPEDLLSRIERAELGLRSRLQEVIRESQQLRELLDQVRREGWTARDSSAVSGRQANPSSALGSGSPDDDQQRGRQLILLRIKQAALQCSKSRDELTGIAGGIDDILEELRNNRLDTPDRSERLVGRVRMPLASVLTTEMADLEQLIQRLPETLSQANGQGTAVASVKASEQLLVRLEEVLKGMLELEGYNELLEIVRGLIEDQTKVREATEKEQKSRVLDLFD
jgi:hypothetical protein